MRSTGQYRRDLGKAHRMGKDIEKLEAAVDTIAAGERLPRRYRQHNLSGNWESHIECHMKETGF